MKTLNKSAFDNNYQYDNYKKQIKKECKATARGTTTKAKLELNCETLRDL